MIVTSFLLVIAAAALDSASGRPFTAHAPNCALTTPPSAAGEVLNHGDVSKVFPRLSDMGRKYTGCQVVWLPVAEHLTLAGFVYYERGRAAVLYSPGGDDMPELVCRYRGKRLTDGPADRCPAAEELGIPSMPAGCATKLLASDDHVPGCDYDDDAR